MNIISQRTKVQAKAEAKAKEKKIKISVLQLFAKKTRFELFTE